VLGLAYDGSGFHGFAPQPGQRTVGGELVRALSVLGVADARLTCAGRTDAGVHARAQVVHVDVDEAVLEGLHGRRRSVGPDLLWLGRSLSSLCGPEIVVWRAGLAPEGFDARHSALARRYGYEISTGERPDPLERHAVWHVGGALDVAVLRLATDPVVGEHDFAAFCRRPPGRLAGPMVRVVHDAHWVVRGATRLAFEIEAGAFCHQMVRSVVGAVVAAGQGRLKPSDVASLLRSGSRAGAPPLAPARGLCLVGVRYRDEHGGWWT
jgi:tRNA pseudouridine38-40 synthase